MDWSTAFCRGAIESLVKDYGPNVAGMRHYVAAQKFIVVSAKGSVKRDLKLLQNLEKCFRAKITEGRTAFMEKRKPEFTAADRTDKKGSEGHVARRVAWFDQALCRRCVDEVIAQVDPDR